MSSQMALRATALAALLRAVGLPLRIGPVFSWRERQKYRSLMSAGWFLAQSINDSASDKSVNGFPHIPLWEGEVQCTLIKPDVPGWGQGTPRLRKSAACSAGLRVSVALTTTPPFCQERQ